MTKDSASGGQVNGPNVEPTNDLRQHRPPFSPPKSPRNNVFTASCFRLLRSSLNESLPSLYIPELFSFRDREGTEIAFFSPSFSLSFSSLCRRVRSLNANVLTAAPIVVAWKT